MTKEQLKADNERLGAEVAALRELLTVIGSAGLPRHAPGQEGFRALQAADRLRDITGLARGLMRYAGSPVFPRVVFTTTETLRGIITAPLAYRAAEGAMPAPVITDSERDCDAVNPDGAWPCHKSGIHGTHRDANGGTWRAFPFPCCGHCKPDCGGQGHFVPCPTPSCTSVQQLAVAS